jgi:hypothetical protein
MDSLSNEEKIFIDVLLSARKLEQFLWGEYNDQWNLEEWKRMFKKRVIKIDDIDINNPHAIIEMRKRLLQNACLSVALINILDTKGIPSEKCNIPSNLENYK